jgi:hypothetical protein
MNGQQDLLQQILDFAGLSLKPGSQKAADMPAQLRKEYLIRPFISVQARDEKGLEMDLPAA